jgi:hypothetical protein
MSAPKRKTPPKKLRHWTERVPIPRATFWAKVLEYPGADEALARITGPALSEELVWHILWDVAFRSDSRNETTDPWYSLPGFPMHTLRRFPDYVRSWAEQIKTLGKAMAANEAYSFRPHSALVLELEAAQRYKIGPTSGLVPERVRRKLLESRSELPKLDQLPSLLELYADYIEAVHKLTANLAPTAATRYKAGAIEALIDCVRRVTGDPHFEEIATLLTAAYAACGSKTVVSAGSLKGRHYRPKK